MTNENLSRSTNKVLTIKERSRKISTYSLVASLKYLLLPLSSACQKIHAR
jgi:hypothetical protein